MRKGEGQMHIQEAVKKETVRIAAGTAVGVLVMFAVFFGLHIFMPESVPFDYKVILGGLGGGFVAVLNFFLMSLMVQKVTSIKALGKSRGAIPAAPLKQGAARAATIHRI